MSRHFVPVGRCNSREQRRRERLVMRSGDTEVVKIAHQDCHLGAFRGLGNEVEISEEQVGAARLLAHGRAWSRGVALGRRSLHRRVGSARGAA